MKQKITLEETMANAEILFRTLLRGCGNHGCVVNPPRGMATNSGCTCRPHDLAYDFLAIADRLGDYRRGEVWNREGGE